MSDAKAKVRADILSFFKEAKAEPGHAFVERFFLGQYAIKYNPKESAIVGEVLDELTTEGVLERRDGKCFLTAVGFDTLNSGSDSEVVQRVKNDILSWFRNAKSRAGHSLNVIFFNFEHVTSYTSREKNARSGAVQELVSEGLVEERNGKIILTQKGVDTIY